MKKASIIIISLVCISLLGASLAPVKMIRLTIINKSGMPMEFRLQGGIDDYNYLYYLRVPEGDRINPARKTFTIYQGEYTLQPYYIELWDPVYGYICDNSASKTLYAFRNIRIVFIECDLTVPNSGEPSMMKFFGRWKYIY